MSRFYAVIALVICLGTAHPGSAQQRFIIVASTTSIEQSGLFGHILPLFRKASGIEVRVVAVGTGQALRLGMRGDADVVFVHDTPAEHAFVADGFGTGRRDVMYNDFIIAGPADDPAGIAGHNDAARAFTQIAAARAPFVSRDDESGTHKAELRLWAATDVAPERRQASWYRQTGSGMGAALNAAAEMNAYVLSDRGTWLSFDNHRNLTILSQGDPRLFNQYGVILVNPARHPHVKAQDGHMFIAWLTSPAGQQAIADHVVGGHQLFFPNATAP